MASGTLLFDAEAAAVVGGGDVQGTQERTAHGLGRAEAAADGDLVDRRRRLLEQPAAGFHTRPLDEAGGGDTDLAAEGAREVARAHRRPLGEAFDGQVVVQMVGDPGLQLAQRLTLSQLTGELSAELRLSARTLEEYDQPPGDGKGDLAP